MRLLVPTDLSEAGLLSIEALCASDATPFADVVLLHVIDLDLYTAGGSIPQIREWAETELGIAADHLRERGFEARALVAEGDVVPTIERVAAEESAGMVMLTSAGRGATDRVFGGVAEALASGATVPVLVDRVGQEYEKWCRTADGSPFVRPLVAVKDAESVSTAASALSGLPGVGETTVLHVVRDHHAGNQASRWLEEATATYDPGVDWRYRIVTGEPVEQVLREVDSLDATLLVVAPRSRPLRRLLAGSVSHELALRSRVPVLFAHRHRADGS